MSLELILIIHPRYLPARRLQSCANVLRATARMTFWGALAIALIAGTGKLFGSVA